MGVNWLFEKASGWSQTRANIVPGERRSPTPPRPPSSLSRPPGDALAPARATPPRGAATTGPSGRGTEAEEGRRAPAPAVRTAGGAGVPPAGRRVFLRASDISQLSNFCIRMHPGVAANSEQKRTLPTAQQPPAPHARPRADPGSGASRGFRDPLPHLRNGEGKCSQGGREGRAGGAWLRGLGARPQPAEPPQAGPRAPPRGRRVNRACCKNGPHLAL